MRALSVLAAASMIFVSGCSDPSTPPAPTPPTPAPVPEITDAESTTVDRYEGVRGRITALPIEDSPTEQDFRIHHEDMPTFKSMTGKVGMNSMTMHFPLGESVSLEGFEIGDAIEFDFEADWGSPPYWVTGLRKLPADTVLDFEKKADEVDPHAGHNHGDKPHPSPAGG